MTRCLKRITAVLMAGMVWAGGCVDNPFSDDSVTYVVETINGEPPSERWLSPLPLEIQLNAYPPGGDYAGNVMFGDIGWVDIIESSKEWFQVPVRYGNYPSDTVYIRFSQLSLRDTILTGRVGYFGATIDAAGPWEFRAVSKE